jgi:hypothetical protein
LRRVSPAIRATGRRTLVGSGRRYQHSSVVEQDGLRHSHVQAHDRTNPGRRSGGPDDGSVKAILARKRDVVTPSLRIAELTADVVSLMRRVWPPTESCGHTRHSRTIIRFCAGPTVAWRRRLATPRAGLSVYPGRRPRRLSHRRLRPPPAVADVADEPPRNGRLLPVKRAGACTAEVRGSNPCAS